MANNPYVNKVVYGGNTLLDITSTTTIASDVISGKLFYTKSGLLETGTLEVSTIHTGSSVPSASLGVDGDIYLQV